MERGHNMPQSEDALVDQLTRQISVDVVIPVYNECDCIEEMIQRLNKIRESDERYVYSFIFVDDGSSDGTDQIILRYAKQQKHIKFLQLSRNFGHQAGVTCGLDFASADYVAIIDSDLQDPPELIPQMVDRATQGVDVVYGKRIGRMGETWFKRATASMFYRLIRSMCRVDIPTDAGDFRVISRKVVLTFRQMRESHRFIRGMVPWAGFPSESFEYCRDRRFAGVTKYPLYKMIRFALDAIFSFSRTPLRLASMLGLGLVTFGLIVGAILVYLRFFTEYSVPGITAVILVVVFMTGVQSLILGVMGEYLGRIFEEVKARPIYVLRNYSNLDIVTRD